MRRSTRGSLGELSRMECLPPRTANPVTAPAWETNSQDSSQSLPLHLISSADSGFTVSIMRRYEVSLGCPSSVTARMMWATPPGHGMGRRLRTGDGPQAAVAVTVAFAVSAPPMGHAISDALHCFRNGSPDCGAHLFELLAAPHRAARQCTRQPTWESSVSCPSFYIQAGGLLLRPHRG